MLACRLPIPLRFPSLRLWVIFLILTTFSGCGDDRSGSDEDEVSRNGVIGRTTKQVAEFDPTAGKRVSDSAIEYSNPITGPLESMGPLMERAAKLGIHHALGLYRAEHDRFPETHEEFMTGVIDGYGIRLPVLPAGAKYEYDVGRHQLVIVERSQ